MITELGKELRKLRIDLGITILNMAITIEVSASFLSAVETGKKPCPANLIDKLAEKYEIIKDKKDYFLRLACLTQREISIVISDDIRGSDAHFLAVKFAEKFPNIDDERIEKIRWILNEV